MRTILFLNENPLPAIFTRGTISGKELRLRASLPYLDAVHVICRRGAAVTSHRQSQSELEEKIVIHQLPPWPYYLAAIPLCFYGLYYVHKLKPLAVEAESPIISGLAAVILGRLFAIPSVVELRASYDQIIKHRFPRLPIRLKAWLVDQVEYAVLRRASLVIANSNTYHNRLKKLGIASVVINPGLQYAPPASPPPRPFPSSFTLGYLGRLVPEKGLSLLLESLSVLKTLPHLPSFHLEIAGTGPYIEELTRLVDRLGLKPLVTFLGMIENYTVLSHWHVLINPCLVNHPLEMVNAEAAYMRVPVVTFGNALIPETVIDQRTGLKVSPKNREALAQALARIMQDRQLYHTLQTHGPHLARSQYSFADQVKRLDSAYRRLGLVPKTTTSG